MTEAAARAGILVGYHGSPHSTCALDWAHPTVTCLR